MSSVICSECKLSFPSKSQLFKHLIVHGYEDPNAKPVKVVLVVGWLADYEDDTEESIQIDDTILNDEGIPINVCGTRTIYDKTTLRVDAYLSLVIHALESGKNYIDSFDDPTTIERPKGYSRASGFSQKSSNLLGAEANLSGKGDVISFSSKPYTGGDDNDWLRKANALLPSNIRVLIRKVLPNAGSSEFNAERCCTQRVYEFCIPFDAFIGHDETISQELLSNIVLAPKKKFYAKSSVTGKYVEESEEVTNKIFNCTDNEGKERLLFFRRLKCILTEMRKNGFSYSVHNFITGGGCPDKFTVRRIDRIKHMYTREVSDGKKSKVYGIFRISGENFLKGQVRHIMGLVLCIACGLLPIEYLEIALSPEYMCDVPSIPGWCVYLNECKFCYWESKYAFRIDPRAIDGQDTLVLDQWSEVLLSHIANQWQQHDASKICILPWRNQCQAMVCKIDAIKSLKRRSIEDLLSTMCIVPAIPAVYKEVLHFLQAADISGKWPFSATGRANVIVNDSTLPAYTGQRNGSFSIGLYPKGMQEPRGNALFPDLLRACFKLEKLLYPNREPSSTIAVNRNAQFRAHRDSGAGSGQTLSMIVGLGNYTGGEIVVEGTAHDIRYKPIEFDGWKSRHSTLPFQGERFSLVYFTPLGVNKDDYFWLNDV